MSYLPGCMCRYVIPDGLYVILSGMNMRVIHSGRYVIPAKLYVIPSEMNMGSYTLASMSYLLGQVSYLPG